jgi:hypothetical protein
MTALSKLACSAQWNSAFCIVLIQWVENNPTNIHIYPTNIRFITSWYYADSSFADVNMDVARC